MKIAEFSISISNKSFELRLVSRKLATTYWVVLGLTIKFYFQQHLLSDEAKKGKIPKFNWQNHHFWPRKFQFFQHTSRDPKTVHIKHIWSYFEFLKNMHLRWFSYFCLILETLDCVHCTLQVYTEYAKKLSIYVKKNIYFDTKNIWKHKIHKEKKQQECVKHVEKHEVRFFSCFLCIWRFVSIVVPAKQ